MLQVKTPALVLDKEPGYNDDGTVTLLTRDFGILRMRASGIYRSGASLAAWTEPPADIMAEIAIQKKTPGFGRLFTLTLRDYFPHLRLSYENLSWFYFYSFLLRSFLPLGSKSVQAFVLLREVLEFQESWKSADKIDLNFAYFLVQLLKKEGICSGFNHCVACEKKFENDETAYFTLAEQGLLCEKCLPKTVAERRSEFSPGAISMDFIKMLPQKSLLRLPSGLLRVGPQERETLEICENSEHFEAAYTNIFSRPKINDQTLAKVRNFLLIFLAPLL